MRLAVVGVWTLVGLGVAAGLLLLPTYVYLRGQVVAQGARLASLEASVAASGGNEVEARLSALDANAALLSALAAAPSASKAVYQVLGISRAGITLSGFSFGAAQGTKPSTLVITGTADTRDHLRAYQLALSGAPFITAADLPISAYAKDSNISFGITLTLTQMP